MKYVLLAYLSWSHYHQPPLHFISHHPSRPSPALSHFPNLSLSSPPYKPFTHTIPLSGLWLLLWSAHLVDYSLSLKFQSPPPISSSHCFWLLRPTRGIFWSLQIPPPVSGVPLVFSSPCKISLPVIIFLLPRFISVYVLQVHETVLAQQFTPIHPRKHTMCLGELF